jgi:hypothetical protein
MKQVVTHSLASRIQASPDLVRLKAGSLHDRCQLKKTLFQFLPLAQVRSCREHNLVKYTPNPIKGLKLVPVREVRYTASTPVNELAQ